MSLTSNYTPKYSVNLNYSKDKKNSGVVSSWKAKQSPKCTCFVCKQKQPTKNLSKEDRIKYKSKVHPICNQCRKKLSKDITRYKAYLRSYYLQLNGR